MSCTHDEVWIIKSHTNIDPATLLADTRIVGYECVECARRFPADHIDPDTLGTGPTEPCPSCGVEYFVPFALHHTEDECDENQRHLLSL